MSHRFATLAGNTSSFSQPPGCAENELWGNYFGTDSLHCVSAHGSHGPLRIYVCGPRREDGGPDVAHFGTTTSELHRMLAWLKERGVESAAMESTSVYWIPVADLLEAEGVEVVLVDAREVKMVPGRKSDVKDCQWLQRLTAAGCGAAGSVRRRTSPP